LQAVAQPGALHPPVTAPPANFGPVPVSSPQMQSTGRQEAREHPGVGGPRTPRGALLPSWWQGHQECRGYHHASGRLGASSTQGLRAVLGGKFVVLRQGDDGRVDWLVVLWTRLWREWQPG